MKRLYGRPVSTYCVPVLLWLLAFVYFALALGFSREGRMLPLLVGAALLVMAPIEANSKSRTAAGAPLRRLVNPAADEEAEPLGGVMPQLRALASMLLFAAFMPLIGIVPAITAYMIWSVRFLGGRPWKQAVLSGLLMGGATYVLFEFALDIALYPGLLFAQPDQY
jgi:hypothetical protein